MLVAGLADRIAKRVDRSLADEEIPRGAYQTTKLKEYVFIDPCSVIYTEEPDYLIFQDIVQLGSDFLRFFEPNLRGKEMHADDNDSGSRMASQTG